MLNSYSHGVNLKLGEGGELKQGELKIGGELRRRRNRLLP